MDIVIIAGFLGPLDGTFNSRFLYLADLLTDSNCVEIITSDFDHGKKLFFRGINEQHDCSIKMLHESGYPTNVCLKRFVSHYIWGNNVKKYLNSRKKPDVIYCAVPTLKAAYEAAKYCERNGVKFVIDIQDLWPEAFKMIIKMPLISSILFSPLVQLANEIYKRADAVCAVSKTYCQRALRVNKQCKSATTVFLGTDLETFDNYSADDAILSKNAGEFWLAYCGTLGRSYDLKCVIDAIARINSDRVRLIVMGDGPQQEEFENYAKGKSINATFTGRLSYSQMCALLSKCDLAMNPIVPKAAASIINKHADYAMAGLPVLSTQENEEYRDLVDSYKMGFNCKNHDDADMADKIVLLMNNESLRMEMGRNARRCGEEVFNRANSYKHLVDEIVREE